MLPGRTKRRLIALAIIIGVLAIPAMAPASITEQRNRLPPAAECGDDNVEGIWKSHQFSPRYGDWYVFTLEIRRTEGDPSRLTGRIRSHSWGGTRQDEEPPADCGLGGFHWTVVMPASGSVTEDGEIRFGGDSFSVEHVYCGRSPLGYNTDHFSGRIDPSINEFQSVNNDGGRSVNVATVFRRVSCFQDPPAPQVNPVAPTFYPETGRGCCTWF